MTMQRFRPRRDPEISAYQLTPEVVLPALNRETTLPGLRLCSASWHSVRKEVHDVKFSVENPVGFISEARLNDWIVIDADGGLQVFGPKNFAALFEPLSQTERQ